MWHENGLHHILNRFPDNIKANNPVLGAMNLCEDVTIIFSFLTELVKKYHTCMDCFTSKICYLACKYTLPGHHCLELVKFPSKVTSLATVSVATLPDRLQES
jgi:hypothetical protein